MPVSHSIFKYEKRYSHEEYCKAFKVFASQVSRCVIIKKGLDITPADTKARIMTYSYDDPSADFHASEARPDELGHYIFDLVHPGGVIKDVRCGVPGWVNVENSVAAAAVCLSQGMPPEAVKASIGSFMGALRRLDVHVASPSLTYIDDYAHHPNQDDVSRKKTHGHIPAPLVHKDEGFRRRVRRGAQRCR